MFINSINSNINNINSKANISLIAERNLLPKNCKKKLVENARHIGDSGDTVHISLYNFKTPKTQPETHVRIVYWKYKTPYSPEFKYVIKGASHKDRQNKTYNVINKYLNILKEKLELL